MRLVFCTGFHCGHGYFHLELGYSKKKRHDGRTARGFFIKSYLR